MVAPSFACRSAASALCVARNEQQFCQVAPLYARSQTRKQTEHTDIEAGNGVEDIADKTDEMCDLL